jgi:hypothetical protein
MQTAGLNEVLLLEEQELLAASIGMVFIGFDDNKMKLKI